ncbi:MAG: 6-phosphogluconolactonase [Candidatus Limnocylindrales bacterium]
MTEASEVHEARIIIVVDEDAANHAAATHIARSLAAAVASRGRADWATTGGSAAPGIYRHLADSPLCDEVPWADVHVWWGDDRFVPRDHPLSNVKPLEELLCANPGLRLPVGNLHTFQCGEAIADGRDASSVARRLAADLAGAGLVMADGFPVLDLFLLGVGGDGHIMSVFPGSEAFDAAAWALAIPAPSHIEPHVARVTMHPSLVRVAREVLVVATGTGKAAILAEVLGPTRDERRWPAQLARHERATWILDDAAAALLPR